MAEPSARPLSALLGKGATYQGDMTFEGRVRVDGIYRGRICTEDTLEIGEGGRVEGDIDVAFLVVAGEANGGVRVRQKLILERTGLLKGRVDAVSLEVRPGGRIDAVVRVG